MSHKSKSQTPWLSNEIGREIKIALDNMEMCRTAYERGGNARYPNGGLTSKQEFYRWAEIYGRLSGRIGATIEDRNSI